MLSFSRSPLDTSVEMVEFEYQPDSYCVRHLGLNSDRPRSSLMYTTRMAASAYQ